MQIGRFRTDEQLIVEGDLASVDAAEPIVDYADAKLLFAVGTDNVAEFRVRGCSAEEALTFLLGALANTANRAGMAPEDFRDWMRSVVASDDGGDDVTAGGYL